MTPLTHYRPTKESDGSGGWVETLGDATTIYGDIQIHKGETVLVCEIHMDIKPEDLISVPGIETDSPAAWYRVGLLTRTPGSRWMSAPVERQDRPIEP